MKNGGTREDADISRVLLVMITGINIVNLTISYLYFVLIAKVVTLISSLFLEHKLALR